MSQTPSTPSNDTSSEQPVDRAPDAAVPEGPASATPAVAPSAASQAAPSTASSGASASPSPRPGGKVEAATSPTPSQAPARSGSGAKAALWLAVVALLVGAASIAASALLWQRLVQTQQEMARRSQDSAAHSLEARTVATQTEALTKELQAKLSVAEVRLSEVSLQRSQLEELMLSLSRSRDDNLVQDIESALRLGQQQAQLTGSVQPLLSALQAADQRIARAAQPRLNPVQRAIARDIERIQGASLADVPSLVLRLDELARQVDEWPVVNEVGPLSGRTAQTAPAVVASVSPQASASMPALSTGTASVEASAPAATLPAPIGVPGWGMDYWRALWDRVTSELSRSGRDLVRVSRIDQPEAALLAPEQAFFLRENVKLKLLNARLGLLARQLPSAQADVQSVQRALSRYFDVGAPAVSGALAALSQLREELVVTDIPRPEESLAALATAAGGR